MTTPVFLAGTGHRPDKLGGYGPAAEDRRVRLAVRALERLRPVGVISGMALGWDMALAEAAVRLGIPFEAAIPFAGQESRWPETSQRRYRDLLGKAWRAVTVCDGGYEAWKMQRRNEWMVDHADAMLAIWNGTPGGTANCVAYAERRGVPVVNLWGEWTMLA